MQALNRNKFLIVFVQAPAAPKTGTRSRPKASGVSWGRTQLSNLAPFIYTTLLSFIACDIVGGAKVPFGNSHINSLRNRVTSIGCTP